MFGKTLRLHPLVVMLVTTGGTLLFGLLGATLAAPVTAQRSVGGGCGSAEHWFLASFALHRWLDSPPHSKTADYRLRWRAQALC